MRTHKVARINALVTRFDVLRVLLPYPENIHCMVRRGLALSLRGAGGFRIVTIVTIATQGLVDVFGKT